MLRVPRSCSVVRLRAPAGTPCEQTTGVVLDVRVRADNAWTHALLAVGTEPKLAKTVSDRAAGGKLASLRAALAYYTAHIEGESAEGIVFL